TRQRKPAKEIFLVELTVAAFPVPTGRGWALAGSRSDWISSRFETRATSCGSSGAESILDPCGLASRRALMAKTLPGSPGSPERPSLDAILKRHFGFQSFRPLQREIIESLLAGHDVLALLPTGGGKSLCYQLPAVAIDGLTIVISPLIALMKDQVDSLEELGVPATFLNSSLSLEEYRRRWRDLNAGRYKIPYLAPERPPTAATL